jgi:hypothetical protein
MTTCGSPSTAQTHQNVENDERDYGLNRVLPDTRAKLVEVWATHEKSQRTTKPVGARSSAAAARPSVSRKTTARAGLETCATRAPLWHAASASAGLRCDAPLQSTAAGPTGHPTWRPARIGTQGRARENRDLTSNPAKAAIAERFHLST